MNSVLPISWDGIATIIAALVAAGIVICGFAHERNLQARSRRAEAYAGALQAVSDYLEAPYRIRRRVGSAEGRTSLTEHVSQIQSRLDFYAAHLELVAPPEVHRAYIALVTAAKSEAGPQMSVAWRGRPTRRDRDVPILNSYPHPRSNEARDVALATMKTHR